MMNLRDYVARYLPSWLGDNYPNTPSFGYRLAWSCALLVDQTIEIMLQASLSAVGRGSSTALAYVGQQRGLLRWQNESDADYAVRLRGWIAGAKELGSMAGLAKQLHGYIAARPAVEIISRSGVCVRCDTDGTITTSSATWNWDSTSNPERTANRGEIFIIVYTTQWTNVGVWGVDGQIWGENSGFGSSNNSQEFDAIRQLVGQWKSAHTLMRCLIVNRNNTRPAPNGNWGLWHNVATDTPSSRDLANNFFWDFVS